MYFYEEMGNPPTDEHTIDRFPDNNGGYWCGKCDECLSIGHHFNCRWATRVEQMRNMRANRLIAHDGLTMCITAWGELTKIHPVTIGNRIDNLGWSIQRALSTPGQKEYKRDGL